ncbi:MAG TPA: 23S rRNA (pseudouridine(1915)-N(3))-methyltransferase RlmH [Candidatus Sulfotelmatobacter sp.]|nr:23S rRNA (pseudouridine(1915)-N(3))-methyltransferase RlmH [Candidatus Sulfotelmatobacter sp.]
MKITIAWIGKTKEPAIQALTDEYLKRLTRYAHVAGVALRDETKLLEFCGRSGTKKSGTSPRSTLVIMDAGGRELTSEQFAKFVGEYRDRNPQPLVFGIGAADGFSETTKRAAQSTLSLGKLTLAHELARVVLLEQIYRAFTILGGHPYHSGH